MVYKRRWTAATVFLLVMAAVTVYTFTATPVFEARTRLLIEAENQNVVSFKEVVDEDQTKADYYQTQYNILQIARAGPQDARGPQAVGPPAVQFGEAAEQRLQRRPRIAGAAGLVTGLFTSAPATTLEPAGADETEPQSKAIDTFAVQLTVAPVRNSRLVDVKFRSADAAVGLQPGIGRSTPWRCSPRRLPSQSFATNDAKNWDSGSARQVLRDRVEAAAASAASGKRNCTSTSRLLRIGAMVSRRGTRRWPSTAPPSRRRRPLRGHLRLGRTGGDLGTAPPSTHDNGRR